MIDGWAAKQLATNYMLRCPKGQDMRGESDALD